MRGEWDEARQRLRERELRAQELLAAVLRQAVLDVTTAGVPLEDAEDAKRFLRSPLSAAMADLCGLDPQAFSALAERTLVERARQTRGRRLSEAERSEALTLYRARPELTQAALAGRYGVPFQTMKNLLRQARPRQAARYA